MKRLALGTLAALTLVVMSSAHAADMPTKAPVLRAPAYDPWTGFYVGANVGYSWGDADRTNETLTSAAGVALFANTGGFDMTGVIGGGQIGYNWRSTNWVFGLEADIQYSGQKGTENFICPTGICSPTTGALLVIPGAAVNGTLDQKLRWFGTLRPRAGILVTPSTLIYGTGGLAYGAVRSNLTLATVVTPANVLSNTTTKAGWTLGAGVETVLTQNWTVKLEYLYVDLGTVSGSFTTTFPALGGGFLGASYRSRITDNIIRIGANYRF